MRSSNVLARSIVALLFIVVFAACAHGGASGAGDPASVKSVVIPPRITQQQSVLRFRTRSPGRFRGTVEIPVDENGRAEIFRIRVMPRMDDLMRQSIEEWLQGVTFIPAKRDGVPVAGVFKMSFR
jgi:hypothetical protein